jgi:hypothetical protein
MKPLIPLRVVFVCALGSIAAVKADESVTPAQVFTQVTKDLPAYKTLETIYELGSDPQPFQVKAWFDDGTFRRVKASQKGDGGLLTRDFFYDKDAGLRFARVTLETEPSAPSRTPTIVEERFDFTDGALVRYLGPDRSPVSKEQENFKEMEKALLAMSNDLVERIEGSTAYAGMIGGVDDPEAKKALAGVVFGAGFTDGVFAGTEQGDYLHLDLKQADGEVATFFVITKDASLDAILAEPAKAKGTRIRVHWTEKMQSIPEAGGATRLKTCDRIELLK